MPQHGSEYPLWEVVGGGDKGGILVRLDCETDSEKLEPRLATGAVVREWDLVGERLQYELVSGEGPPQGWVSIRTKDKDLVVRYDEKAIRPVPLGTVLPPVQRGPRCPGLLAAPEASRNTYRKMAGGQEREPRLYVIMFPGAEDEVLQGWLKVESQAPPYVEIATYEWPGHGVRKKEPFCSTLEALGDDAFETFKDAMKRGQFILVGHSIGALIVTHVCRRAHKELRVKPHAAIVLDRGPPHLPVLSQEGHEFLLRDPEGFASIFVPGIKVGTDAWKMRTADQAIDDDTRPVGWFRFPCPVHIIAAGFTMSKEWPPTWGSEEWFAAFVRLHRAHSGTRSSPFPDEEYELWSEWAAERSFQRFEDVSHRELKHAPQVLDFVHGLALKILSGG